MALERTTSTSSNWLQPCTQIKLQDWLFETRLQRLKFCRFYFVKRNTSQCKQFKRNKKVKILAVENVINGAALIIAFASTEHSYPLWGIRSRQHCDEQRFGRRYDRLTEDCSKDNWADPLSALPTISSRTSTLSNTRSLLQDFTTNRDFISIKCVKASGGAWCFWQPGQCSAVPSLMS